MDRDRELAQRVAVAGGWAARVYTWDQPTVSLGCFQKPELVLRDLDSVPYVARPTGGKAVLHGHDITVGLSASLTALGLNETQGKSVGRVYRALTRPLIQALQGGGVPAELGERTGHVTQGRGRVADCFAAVSRTDIVHRETGVKVCGCALRVTNGVALAQASIPVMQPEISPQEVFIGYASPVLPANLEAEKLVETLDRALNDGLR
jgi:lipoate-protein ligase A